MLLLCVAGAAGVPLPAGSSAGVLSASGDNAASNDAAPARYLFLHIPKTGGSSFVDDAAEHALVSCGHLHCVHVDERQKKWEGDGLPQLAASPRDCNLVACEGELTAVRASLALQVTAAPRLVLLVREPTSHVLSMWRHCLWHGPLETVRTKPATNMTLVDWIRRPAEVLKDAGKRCYGGDRGPKDIQTAVLGPSLSQALAVVKTAYHVGVQGYYAASLCLLIQRVHGTTSAANDLCSCSSGEATRRKAQTHADHGIDFDPVIDKVALEEIQKVTMLDSVVHTYSLRRLHADVGLAHADLGCLLKDAEAPPALAVGPGADAGIRTAAAGASAGFDDEDWKRSALVLAAPASARGSLPVVYLHFHKAGGTTACEAFEKGRLRTVVDGHNCNCNSPEFFDALRAGDGAKVASFMRQAGVDVCFVEQLQYWPTASEGLAQLRGSVRVVTTLREPWQRLVSNYERDSELCRHLMLVSNASLEKSVDPFLYAYDGPHEILPLREYGEMRGCYPRIKYGLQLPDLYVRALNGAAKATTTDVAAMDDASLERAKEVLAAFDEVLVLERPDFSARLAALTHSPQASVPHQSNNKYSDDARHVPANIAAARANHAHESEWLNTISRLDAELYSWAFSRK